MVGPIVLEEVEAVLTVNAEHGDEIGGVDTVTEELHTHAGLHVGRSLVDWRGRGHADVSGVATLEDSSVRMVAKVDPLDFADVADGVDSLITAASPAAVKLVTLGVKDLLLADKKGLSEVPSSRFGVFSDLGPDFVRLLLASKSQVVIAFEILAVLGSDGSDETSGRERFEHSK